MKNDGTLEIKRINFVASNVLRNLLGMEEQTFSSSPPTPLHSRVGKRGRESFSFVRMTPFLGIGNGQKNKKDSA